MLANKLNNISLEAYLSLERENDIKYEFHDGTVYAMAGGTVEHGLICGNIHTEIKIGLRNKKSGCTAVNSEVKLHVAASNKYLYPDAMVLCNNIEDSKKENTAVINPTVIVEVLSKSTESYDRGDKFFTYRQIESLEEYILINQYRAQIDIYKRKSDLWSITRIEGIDEILEISSLGISIRLEDVYEGVVFQEKV